MMLPDTLGKYTNLQRITMVLRVTPTPRFYSCFTSLLSNISSSCLSNVFFSFRPMLPESHQDIGLQELVAMLDISPVLSAVDSILAHEQFECIQTGGIRIELATQISEMSTILDNALEPAGGWEGYVKQSMPSSTTADLLHCVR